MDGGGRVLGSLIDAFGRGRAAPQFGFAGLPGGAEPFRPPLRVRRPRPLGFAFRLPVLVPRTARGGLGVALTAALFAATGLYGTVRGGQYADFVAHHGSPLDVVARHLGFPIAAVTISGLKELDAREILTAAGVTPDNSLLFLNAAAVRDRLTALPLVRDAVVGKLFPDRLTIALDERDPKAIWQNGGALSIVSSDGVVIDTVTDDRFNGLPFVVGEGANAHFNDYLALLDRAGDLRPRIVAGMRVGDRRWSVKLDNGVEVMLPEQGANEAMDRLVALDRQAKLLDKDVVSIDLRVPNRVSVRLSAEAAAARAEVLAKKAKLKGAPQ